MCRTERSVQLPVVTSALSVSLALPPPNIPSHTSCYRKPVLPLAEFKIESIPCLPNRIVYIPTSPHAHLFSLPILYTTAESVYYTSYTLYTYIHARTHRPKKEIGKVSARRCSSSKRGRGSTEGWAARERGQQQQLSINERERERVPPLLHPGGLCVVCIRRAPRAPRRTHDDDDDERLYGEVGGGERKRDARAAERERV